MNNMVFWGLDLEMEQPSNEIISIGVSIWVPDANMFKTDSPNFLITPSQPISQFIQDLTGLNDSMYKWDESREIGFRKFVDYMNLAKSRVEQSGLKWFREPITWGAGDLHTLRSQMPFIQQDFMGRRFIDVKTLSMMERVFQNKSISGKMGLRSGLSGYGLAFEGSAHNSAVDAYNTMRLFNAIVEKNKKRYSLLEELKNL